MKEKFEFGAPTCYDDVDTQTYFFLSPCHANTCYCGSLIPVVLFIRMYTNCMYTKLYFEQLIYSA